jgi:D-serine dehydratase
MMPPGPGLKPALELWACVHSMPEPGRAIVSIGKRDTSFDAGLPRPIKWCRSRADGPQALVGHEVVRLDDQHAYLDIPAESPLIVGDLVGFGISHPCTTFDRWPALYLVDDGLTVTGTVQTFF